MALQTYLFLRTGSTSRLDSQQPIEKEHYHVLYSPADLQPAQRSRSPPRSQASLPDKIKAQNPGKTIARRNLAIAPLPHIDELFTAAIRTPVEARTAEQAEAIKVSDELVDELLARRHRGHRHRSHQLQHLFVAEGLDRQRRPRRPHLHLHGNRPEGSGDRQEGLSLFSLPVASIPKARPLRLITPFPI